MMDPQEEKIKACRKTVEQHPQDAEVYFQLRLACRKGKRFEEAAQAYENSVHLNPSTLKPKRFMPLFSLTQTFKPNVL